MALPSVLFAVCPDRGLEPMVNDDKSKTSGRILSSGVRTGPGFARPYRQGGAGVCGWASEGHGHDVHHRDDADGAA